MLAKLLRCSILPTVCFAGTMMVFSSQANANPTQAQCVPLAYGEFETVIQHNTPDSFLGVIELSQ
ncbi:hypothetical protein NEA10_10300 [Phormidium yuhuli AB48]|uniref:Uncharacterized protein n=1 Tax=Phormidium yuhuli AB48 TaxID=2940671 RepID=A0ABY5AKI4_9CYAN|nr:hypothetical protein [Phormidium yuhuli]USR89286.1 hypothetical protein NEA10_10300 [Phormidium yuhuli AB48]